MRIAVIGLGQFGRKIATTLFSKGAEVLALDKENRLVDSVKDLVTQAVNLDVTDEVALKSVNVSECDIAIVTIGDNLEMSVLATAILKNLGIPMIISRATTDIQAQILYRVGANRVVNIEAAMGENIADSLVKKDILKHVPLSSGHSLTEVLAPPRMIGKTLLEIDVRKNFGVNIIAIRRTGKIAEGSGETATEVIDDLPGPETVLAKDDILVLVGQEDRIQKFISG